jgi:hydroxymethylglutaryl-CoA lyase
MSSLKLVECPRDAMQGIHDFIPTSLKVEYLNLLLKCGFDTLDFGSFVSPKAIPQLKDTAEVLEQLENSKTKLLAIVANGRGAETATQFDRIDYLGFPFSISQEFQKRNTNTSIDTAFSEVEKMQNLCVQSNKKLVVYLSMGFGNPYGEKWNVELLYKWCNELHSKLGIETLALSDTIGAASPSLVEKTLVELIPELPNVEIGVHLHTIRESAKDLIEAAFNAGCTRFDGALKGFGGCPMATDNLTGNMPTELMLEWFSENNIETQIDSNAFEKAYNFSSKIFNT